MAPSRRQRAGGALPALFAVERSTRDDLVILALVGA